MNPPRVVLLGLFSAFLACTYIACESDPGATDMAAEIDFGAFIPCSVEMGEQTNPQCPPDRPMCHPLAAVCVGCIPSMQTCQPGFECSEDFRCLPIDPSKPCKRNVDCPKRVDGADPMEIICNTETGMCQQCVTNVDCVALDGGPGICEGGRCVMTD